MIKHEPHPYMRSVVSTVEYLENEKGSVELSFCVECGEVTSFICEHKNRQWTGEEGNRKLICDLCNRDLT